MKEKELTKALQELSAAISKLNATLQVNDFRAEKEDTLKTCFLHKEQYVSECYQCKIEHRGRKAM